MKPGSARPDQQSQYENNLENDHHHDMKIHFPILVYNSFVILSGYVAFTIMNYDLTFFNKFRLLIKKKKKSFSYSKFFIFIFCFTYKLMFIFVFFYFFF